jgi:hypothetical protein
MLPYIIGAAVGSVLTLTASWLRREWRTVRPLIGDAYFLDGRLVHVIGVQLPGAVGCNCITIDSRQRIPWSYWKRRARPAAQEPGRLLSIAREESA